MLFLALIYIAFISLGLPDSLLGSAWPIMSSEMGLPSGNAGFISMIISIGTIIASLFSYKVIHRFGTGKVTFVSVMLTAVSLLGFGFAPSMIWLFICAIPLGLGAGAVDSGLNEFVAENYKASHMNWLHCFWGVGALTGPIIVSQLSKHGFGWRSGYFTVSGIQFIVVVLLFASLPMWKKMQASTEISIAQKQANGIEGKPSMFSAIRAKGAIWAMLSFFMYCGLENSFMLWGASYLVLAKNLHKEDAAGWVSLFFVGITLGRFLCGVVALKIKSATLIKLGSIIALVGLFLMLLPMPVPVTLVAYVVVGFGFAPVFPGILHQTPVLFGKQHAQAAMALQMACAYTGVTLVPPILGQVLQRISFKLMPPILFVGGLVLLMCILTLGKVTRAKEKDIVNEEIK